jgi:hypothetical protein
MDQFGKDKNELIQLLKRPWWETTAKPFVWKFDIAQDTRESRPDAWPFPADLKVHRVAMGSATCACGDFAIYGLHAPDIQKAGPHVVIKRKGLISAERKSLADYMSTLTDWNEHEKDNRFEKELQYSELFYERFFVVVEGTFRQFKEAAIEHEARWKDKVDGCMNWNKWLGKHVALKKRVAVELAGSPLGALEYTTKEFYVEYERYQKRLRKEKKECAE